MDNAPATKKRRKAAGKDAKEENNQWDSSAAQEIDDFKFADSAADAEDGQHEINNDVTPEKRAAGLKRKRSARNVGGWISPLFAENIDRSWLEQDCHPDKFDLSRYVPQVGECVLYYPLGHKKYLEDYPDVVAKKTKSTMRVPLWERAIKREKDEQLPVSVSTEDMESTQSSHKWWNEDWLTRMDNDTALYPLLCRVERTYAEFIPDPTKKIAKGDIITWEEPQDSSVIENMRQTPLRLALVLRPLTTVMPPLRAPQPLENEPLSLPPTFSVVTFPSKLPPFIIPFAWAYSITHSLSLGIVKLRQSEKKAETYRLSAFAALSDEAGSCRLDDKADCVNSIVANFEGALSKHDVIEKSLATGTKGLSVRDGMAVLDIYRCFLKKTENIGNPETNSAEKDNTPDLFGLISCTLPLWKSAFVMRSVHDRKIRVFSPWDLVAVDSDDFESPYSMPRAPYVDDVLRMEIVYRIEEWSEDHPFADVFYYPVPFDEAPLYGCAVPVSCCVQKILRRLRSENSNGNGYYTSVESILADMGSILDNCLLYNSPDSPVAESAVKTVSGLKDVVTRVANLYYQELREARKVDHERRRLVTQITDAHSNGNSANNVSKARGPVACTLREPFSESLYEDWLESLKPCNRDATFGGQWVPQSGDSVLYSRRNHARFVKEHYRSFEPYQCVVQSELSDHDDEFVPGVVLWTRACFPKAPSPKSGEDANTFKRSSTILALGLVLKTTGDHVTVVYFRPCLFYDEISSIEDSYCPTCGLSTLSSFIRPMMTEEASTSSKVGDFEASSIVRCLSLLKKRCMHGENAAQIDPRLSKENVKNGYVVPHVRVGVSSLPSYEDMFTRKDIKTDLNVGTRGSGSRIRNADPSTLPSLIEAGFLPPWASGSSNWLELLADYGRVSPWPKLSLELILLRLHHDFYRHRSAIENDVIEAFISQVLSLLSGPASRRKAPVSLKRIARQLPASKLTAIDPDPDDTLACEEASLACKIRKIRELHTVALVSVTETVHVERLLGLVNRPTVNTKVQNSMEDPVRRRARETLGSLLSALKKDELQNKFGRQHSSVPRRRIKIVCDDTLVGHARYFSPIDRAGASLHGSDVKVKIVCGGELITGGKEAVFETKLPISVDHDEEELKTESPSNGERKLPPDSVQSQRVRLKIISGGRLIKSGERSYADALVPEPLGNFKLVRRVDTSIFLSRNTDYEGNDSLVRVLFGRPGRMNACSRCQAYRRSMYTCRVKKSHSNVDFDWVSTFTEFEGVDGLLKSLHPRGDQLDQCAIVSELADNVQDKAEVANSHIENTTVDTTNASTVSADDVKEGISPKSHTFCVENNREEQPALEETRDEQSKIDAADSDSKIKAAFENAEALYSLAREVMKEAETYAQAPARLGKDFIQKNFPIDDDDGHFVYCVVCGLSGDLLCCDGCPNVVHSECVSLSDIPEGDWYCEECSMKHLGTLSGPPSTLRLPFGRLSFNHDKADVISKHLNELHALRPPQYQRKAKEGSQHGSDWRSNTGGDSDGEREPVCRDDVDNALVPSSPGGTNNEADEQPFQQSPVAESPPEERNYVNPAPFKRRRGRPRKNSPSEDATSQPREECLLEVEGIATPKTKRKSQGTKRQKAPQHSETNELKLCSDRSIEKSEYNSSGENSKDGQNSPLHSAVEEEEYADGRRPRRPRRKPDYLVLSMDASSAIRRKPPGSKTLSADPNSNVVGEDKSKRKQVSIKESECIKCKPIGLRQPTNHRTIKAAKRSDTGPVSLKDDDEVSSDSKKENSIGPGLFPVKEERAVRSDRDGKEDPESTDIARPKQSLVREVEAGESLPLTKRRRVK